MITKIVKGIETGNEVGLVTVIETVTESVRRTEGIVTRTEKESVRRRENERKRRRRSENVRRRGKERRNEKKKKSERRKESVKEKGRKSGSEETRRIAIDLHLNPPEDQLHHPLKVNINQKRRMHTTTDVLHRLQSLKTKRSRIHPQK